MGLEIQPPTCVDYYADLGVSQDASTQEVRHAYYRLAKETHPDKNNNETTHTPRFRKAQEAYEFLCDAARREVYDRKYPSIREEWARYRKHIEGEENPTIATALAEEERRAEQDRQRIEEYRRRMEESIRRMQESRRVMEENRRKMAGCNRTIDDFFARWQSLQFPSMMSVRC
ncbi:DnaJ domain-containing protein [Xylaria sp. FL0043]|nr:DnaJ domain-containing protein [Xylaria sp. FL0043]